jgi:prepilin-type N-terminal cleavage/methylation domain-containing protein
MNKKAFTLIEVLVSVVILSTVAVMLFEISTNSKNNFSFLSSKASFTTLASLPLMQNDTKYHNSDKPLFEYIKYDFDIKDDELRKYLKEKKIHYDQEEFSTFSPLSEGDDKENKEMSEDKEQDMMNFTIIFDKIIISD